MNAKTSSESPRRHWLDAATGARMRKAAYLAVPVFVLVLVIRALGLLEGAGLALVDRFQRSLALEHSSPRVIVVGFAESDHRYAGSYPVSDELLADIIERVHAAGPAAMFLNFLRDAPVEPGHARLLEVYARAPELYAFDTSGPEGPGQVPAPPVLREAGRYGFLKAISDEDGVTRVALLGYRDAEGTIHEGALLKVARAYLAAQGIELGFTAEGALRVGDRRHPPLPARAGEYAAKRLPEGLLSFLLPFPHRLIESVSFEDVARGRVPPERFAGKLVLIGNNTLTLSKATHTPLHPRFSRGISPVMSNAYVLDGLLAVALDGRPPPRVLPRVLESLLLYLVAWFSCWRLLGYRSVWSGLLRGSLVLTGALAIGWIGFRLGWWLPVAAVLATMLASVLMVFENLIRAEQGQRRVVRLMHQVFDRLPEPIYLLDHAQRFRMVNEAFSRLAVQAPERLLTAPSSEVFAPEPPDDGGGPERTTKLLIASTGERFRLRVRESVLADEHGRPLTVGMVEAVSREREGGVHDSALPRRFEAASYWAVRRQERLVLAVLDLSDPELLESAYGPAVLAGVDDAILARLRDAFPDAEAIEAAPDHRYWILLCRADASLEPGRLRTLLEQAFGWPVSVAGERVEVDLCFGCATYGPDGETLERLRAVAVERRVELTVSVDRPV